jgi:hypothetical protein
MSEHIANSFTLPVADRLCDAVRASVEKFGGPGEVFGKLDAGAFADGFAESEPNLRRVLGRCLEDLTFRARMVAHVSTTANREYLAQFLDALDVWKELEPADHHWVTLALSGAPLDKLFGPIPMRTNEVFRCSSVLQLDSHFEDLRIKSVIQLAFPNKELGGDDAIILSASVTSFLDSIRLMLRSVELQGSEATLFKIPKDKDSDIIPSIIRELGQVRSVVETLLKQFQDMS